MLLLAYPGNPLINKVFPKDIENELLILTETGFSYRVAFERIPKDSGIKPNITLETSSVQAIKQFTMSGLGITVLPQVAVKSEVNAKKLIPLNWASSELNIISQIIYHKDKWISPALREFIALSNKFLKANSR